MFTEKNGLCKGISPQDMALYGTVPWFQNAEYAEIPIDMGDGSKPVSLS